MLETIHAAASTWHNYRLREVATKVQDGTHFSPKLGGSEYRYITSKNIGPGHLKLDSVEMISESEHRKIYQRCDVKRGDLLLTKDGANTGNAAISTFDDEVSLLSSVAFIRTNHAVALERYVLHYFLSGPGRRQIEDAMTGNAITRLTLEKINNLIIPLPPIKRQTETADVLDEVDSLITSTERLIAKKRAIKQGMMQQLLTGVTRMPGFAAAWTDATIGSLARVTGGGTPSTRVPTYWGGDIPWFTPAEIQSDGAGVVARSARTITSDGLVNSAASLLPAGTVLVTSRASIAHCAVAAVPVATNQGFASMIPQDNRSTWFLYYWIQQHKAELESRAAGSTFLEISARKVASIPMRHPALDEQQAIGEALRDADLELDALRLRLSKMRSIKQGMMQELLTGRTRIRPAKARI